MRLRSCKTFINISYYNILNKALILNIILIILTILLFCLAFEKGDQKLKGKTEAVWDEREEYRVRIKGGKIVRASEVAKLEGERN